LRILLVEDDPGDVRLVRELLADAHAASRIQLNVVDSFSSAQRELGTGAFDAVLVDLGLRDTQGLETVRRLRSI
jgi:DNA-binding response OmpR family regulator